MELFTCFLENNYELYHGTDTKIKKIQEIPMWFSDKNYASLYGKYVYKFKTKKKLKLIDINSGIFKMHYINEINNIFDNYKDRMRYLISLGLPNYFMQEMYLNKPECIYGNKMVFDTVSLYLNFNNNNNRFSRSGRNINSDNDFIFMLRKIYNNFDGYISKQNLPSHYHCGFIHPEICLFSCKDIELINFINNKQNGGKKNVEKINYIPNKIKILDPKDLIVCPKKTKIY